MTQLGQATHKQSDWFAPCALLLFAALLAQLIRRHEPWHDELQAWRLAMDSASPIDLIRNLRYEGHPLFPYLLLRILTRASRSWSAVIIAHALIACGSAWIVLRHAPFGRLHRLLVVFGYFFIFEYGVIARPYGLGMFFALAACAAWCAPRRRETTAAILLILLANTSAVGLALAIALAFGFTIDAMDNWGARWWVVHTRLRSVISVWAVVALVTLAVSLQILPPADAVYRGGGAEVSTAGLWLIGRALSLPARAMLPFASTMTDGSTQWNTWAFEPASRMQVVLTDLLSCLIVLAGAVVVSRRRSALLLWLVGCGGFLVYFTLFHPGAVRHHGYIAVLFIAAAWLAFERAGSPWRAAVARVLDRFEPFRMPMFTLLLLPMLGAALQLARADTGQQFASASGIVTLLQHDRLRDLPIVGASYPWSQPVAALLDRPIALPIEGRNGTWVDAGRVRYDRSASDLIDSTVLDLSANHCRVIVLIDDEAEVSPWLRAQLRPVSVAGLRPMSGRAVEVWIAVAPRCAGATEE